MANLGFSLRSTFGLIPKTDKIETQRKSLEDEFHKLQEYKSSDELKEFNELEEVINSEEFKANKSEILSLNFKNSDEFAKEQKFLKLSKDKRITNYYRVVESSEYKNFIDTENSAELNEFNELDAYLSSNEHAEIKKSFESELKQEQNKAKEFKALSKSKNIVNFYKISKSSQLSLYNEVNNSEELSEFNELEAFIKSDQLKEFKSAIAEQLNIEKNKKNQLKELSKNAEIIAYNKLKDKSEAEKPNALIEYEELQSYLNSEEYKQKLNELEYKNTEEFKKETRFNLLQKSSKLKKYFKFAASQQLAFYEQFKESEDLKEYESLKQYIASDSYKTNLQKAEYKNSEEYQKEVKYNELKNSQKIKAWQKYQKSKPYLLFKDVENSELLEEFNSLKTFIESSEFNEFKTYMLDKDKWKKTDNYQKETRYQELKNSDTIKWYYKTKESDKFNELQSWKLTFEDDFDTGKIDEQKWMNSFFWGKMLLNDRYVMAGDKHYYTDNKNIEFNGTTLKILTKKESASGKVWHPVQGFSNADFEYTSGMLCSAHSFRQQYGRFEAKIKIDPNYPVYQAFWLKGEKMVPEIDVFKYNMDKKNRFQMSSIWGNPSDRNSIQRKTEKINGSSLAKNFYIYTLDWTENKIIWKINGMEVFSSTDGIPQEPLYLLLSAGIQKDINNENLPSAFEIDWVRCYEKVE